MTMNETYAIKAQSEDIDELTRIRIAYLTEDHGEMDKDTKQAVENSLPDYYRRHLNNDLFCYVIKDGARIICSAFLLVTEKPMSPSFINGKTGTVLNVYTEPDQRRKGYGKKVMEALLIDAKRMNLCTISLLATKDGQPLYAKLGFAEDVSKYQPMKYEL